jgi:phenylacetate-coenzyme A ligase PaaK-like adenylate-forming protein
MTNFKIVDQICEILDPLHWTEKKTDCFIQACRIMAEFHLTHNLEIRYLYNRHGFSPKDIQTEKDLELLPPLGVAAMKRYLITSLPHEKATLKLSSSGTRGQITQIWFDQGSLNRVQAMMNGYFLQEGWISSDPVNYLIFNYNPEQSGNLGIAYSIKNQLRFAPANNSFFSIQKDEKGEWVFEKEKTLYTLKRYCDEKFPIRIIGMPSFIYDFTLFLKSNQSSPFRLPNQSRLFTAGGWKAAEERKISRAQFRSLCVEAFGIPEEFQRDGFGMAEHSAPYFECKHHRFHIPVYNRILIRDPFTFQCLTSGEVGLMELITPFNAMMPTLSILSTDYGRIYQDPCLCGLQSPTFEVIGRAGIQLSKGCAFTAQDWVKR